MWVLTFIAFPIPVTMIGFETLWQEISCCLDGDFYNRLDDKVEKHDLYFVLNVFNIKKGEFFLVCVFVDVKLPVFLVFVIKQRPIWLWL